jgi:hypothetical protein
MVCSMYGPELKTGVTSAMRGHPEARVADAAVPGPTTESVTIRHLKIHRTKSASTQISSKAAAAATSQYPMLRFFSRLRLTN